MTKVDKESQNAMQIVMTLLNIGANLLRTGNRISDEFGLKQQQFVVLNEIANIGEVNQKQLVGELLYEKSNVSKIVKKLKALGLIEVTPSPEDGRITMLRITTPGKKTWVECMTKFDAWNREWIKPLTTDEITDTIQMLKRLKKL
jgi:DNA-binding MarR family transcriptional regulator